MAKHAVSAEQLQRIVDEAVPDATGPGCVLALVDGDWVTAVQRGLANIEHGVPIAVDTVFHIASISKQFAAYAVHLLVAEGRLTFDTPVARVLPWVPFDDVTVVQMVQHTSGLRDQWRLWLLSGRNIEDVIATQDIVELTKAQRSLEFLPGTRYSYSNTGYTLLGLIVHELTGQTLAEFCRERIFEPLGMDDTLFLDDHHRIVPRRADSYERSSKGEWERIHLSYSNAGATSLNTTVGDFAKWLRFAATPELRAAREEWPAMPSPDDEPYGLGVHTGSRAGEVTVSHSGADAGYRSYFVALPELGVGAVAFSNDGGMEPGRLCDAALDLLLGAASEAAASGVVAGEKPGAAATPAAEFDEALRSGAPGTYLEAESGLVTLTIEGDGAVRLSGPFGPVPLVVAGPDRLESEKHGLRIRFDGGEAWLQPSEGAERRLQKVVDAGTAVAGSVPSHHLGAFYSEELKTRMDIELDAGGAPRLARPFGVAMVLSRVADDVYVGTGPGPFGPLRASLVFSASGDSFAYDCAGFRNLRFHRAAITDEIPPSLEERLLPAEG